MLESISFILPVFLLIGVGWIMIRTGVIPRQGLSIIAAFALNVALPALIFQALATRPAAEVLNLPYLAAYGGASLVLFAAVFAFARLALGRGASFSAAWALGMSVSNTGFVGYPVTLLVLGSPAAVAMALNMMVENIVMLPLAIAIMEGAAGEDRRLGTVLRNTAARLVRQPILIAIVFGCIFSFGGIGLPMPLARAVDMLAGGAAAVALFYVGGMLVGLNVRGNVGNATGVVIGKLILHPILVFLAVMLVPGISEEMRLAAVIYAAVPMISIYPLLAERYGHGAMATAALMTATLASFATLAIVLWLVRSHPF